MAEQALGSRLQCHRNPAEKGYQMLKRERRNKSGEKIVMACLGNAEFRRYSSRLL